MRQFLLTVFAATLCIIEPSFAQDETLDRAPWDNAASGLDGSVVAFVGEKIFVEERNLEETMDVTLPDGSVVARVIPKMSDRYEARYKIFDVVGGNYTAPEIDFEAWDHYGRASFSRFDPALFFAINREGKWVLQQYLTTIVFETTDGDWAKCGGLRSSTFAEKFEPSPESYEEPIGFLAPQQFAEGKPCLSGVRASKIFNYINKTSLAPQRRRIACNREMVKNDSINVGMGSAADKDLNARMLAACISRLEAEDTL